MSRLMLNLHETAGKGILADTRTSMVFTTGILMMDSEEIDEEHPVIEGYNVAASPGIEMQELSRGF